MITIQIGQCGNQLGHAFFQKLAEEEAEQSIPSSKHSDYFFHDNEPMKTAKAVLIDMEPKVIQQCLQSTSMSNSQWKYNTNNTYMKQSGSGNNWANGYKINGTQAEDDIFNLLQKEAERNDFISCIHTIQSVAGGTGSGLGSFICEKIADHFSSEFLLSSVVWPYELGEVIVQNYNAVLTLASLSAVADGILVLQNDSANSICRRALRIDSPSFGDLNSVLATHMASVMLPLNSPQDIHLIDEANPIEEIQYNLCQHPGYKLLDIKSIPQIPKKSKAFSTHAWSGILKHLYQMHITNSALEDGLDWRVKIQTSDRQYRSNIKAVSGLLFLRGEQLHFIDDNMFQDRALYSDWSLSKYQWYTCSRPFGSYDKTAAFISNSNSIVPTLQSTADKAFTMFSEGAYVHQYQRYGIDKEDFQEAFLKVDQIIQNYIAL